jgi:hypothetical protein
MLIATHEVVAKKTFEFNLEKKKKNLPTQIHLIMGQNVMNDS